MFNIIMVENCQKILSINCFSKIISYVFMILYALIIIGILFFLIYDSVSFIKNRNKKALNKLKKRLMLVTILFLMIFTINLLIKLLLGGV